MTQRYEQEGGPGNLKTSPEVFVPLKAVQQIIGKTPLIDRQRRSLLEEFEKLQERNSKTGVFFDPQTLSIIEGLVDIQKDDVADRTVEERIRHIARMVELKRDGHEEFLSDVENDLGSNDKSQKMSDRERRLMVYKKIIQLKEKADQVEELKKEAQKTGTEGEHIAAAIRIVLGLTGVRFQDLSPLEQRRITGDLKAHEIDTFDPDKM